MAFGWRKKVIDKVETEEEMSMEEILSSIRKYVIDEKGPAIATTTSPHAAAASIREDDVIELTQPLDEKDPPSLTSSVVTPILQATAAKQNLSSGDVIETRLSSSAKADDQPSAQTTRAANIQTPSASQTPIQIKKPQPTPFQSAQYPFHSMPPLPNPPAQNVERSKAHEPLVSPKATSEVAQAFARLAEVTQQPQTEHKFALTGDTTIEQLVTEVTKPIIKSWLDGNLASLVETMVTKEIERITGSFKR